MIEKAVQLQARVIKKLTLICRNYQTSVGILVLRPPLEIKVKVDKKLKQILLFPCKRRGAALMRAQCQP
jgi:hypothetical protein